MCRDDDCPPMTAEELEQQYQEYLDALAELPPERPMTDDDVDDLARREGEDELPPW